MNTKRILAAMIAALALPLVMRAQGPPAPVVSRTVPLRIQVVFSEYEGEKKVGNLPYVLNHNADSNRETRTSLRMGIRVPVTTKDGQVQYQNVGTDIDSFVRVETDGSFRTTFELRRSSIYSPTMDAKQGEWKPTDSALPGNPFIREFSGRVDALLRDGQSTQSTMATDPVSGRTLRVDVTLTVIK